jgi:imidazolonepropionase
MIDAGLAVALASDFNPGTAPSGNMRFVVSLASIKMKMTPAEALNAATINSAAAMGESKDFGSISRGKVANFYITKPLPSLAYLPYAHQTPIIKCVVLKGKRVE